MAERRSGAGSRLSGVLERATPHNPSEIDESEIDGQGGSAEADQPSNDPAPTKPRSTGRKSRAADRTAKRVKGRTIYLPDDLFERILIQSHRRDKTISEYVTMVLERQVPDYRQVRSEPQDPENGSN